MKTPSVTHARHAPTLLAAAIVLLLLAAVTPGSASAQVDGTTDDSFRAVTINTPGQSGHVNALDAALILGGQEPTNPHLTDQIPLYEQLKYRPGNFIPAEGLPAAVLPGAEIYRDTHGVPAIYGDDLTSAWRAVGYAISEDRMWQQHLLRMVALGRSSEILGDDGLEMDIAQRRDYYTEAEYRAFFDDLEDWERSILEAYADGVNLYIAEMHANPARMPAEIAALAEPVEPWEAWHSLALGALMARNVASDGGQELENAQLLRDLAAAHGEETGRAIFDDVLWLNDPAAPTSVPVQEGRFPSYPHGAPAESALPASSAVARDLPGSFLDVAGLLSHERDLKRRLQDELGLPNPGSNVWAVSPERSANGHAFLFNGPQVGYTVAGLLTEFELHITGGDHVTDAKGVTVAGVPVVGIGYTDHHAWGLTSGLSDTIDLYVEQLADGDPRSYVFEGEVREMECRTETFLVKGTLHLADGNPPRIEEREFCRTVHGPVVAVDEQAGVAYSQRYAIWGEEVGTLKGLMRFPGAQSLDEFTDAMRLVTWNENTTYADRDGNIAYWHPGRYPKRPRGFDERLPYPGTGEAEWEGFLTFEQMPHTINPRQGWVANWNSKPSKGWTSGDPHYGDRPWGVANRLDMIGEPFRAGLEVGALPEPDEDGLVTGTAGIFAPDVNGGLHDHTIDYFRPWLSEAASSPAATARQREALRLMLEWDGAWDLDRDGTADHAGATLFDHFIVSTADGVFDPYLTIGGFGRLSGHPWDPSPKINMLLRAFQGEDAALPQSRDYLGAAPTEVILAGVDATLAALGEEFGDARLAEWRGAARRAELEVQGLGPGGEFTFQDRGSWIEVIEYPVDCPPAKPPTAAICVDVTLDDSTG